MQAARCYSFPVTATPTTPTAMMFPSTPEEYEEYLEVLNAPSPAPNPFPNDGIVAKVQVTCTKDFGLLKAGTVVNGEIEVRFNQARVVLNDSELPNFTIHPILFLKDNRPSGGHWDKFVLSA